MNKVWIALCLVALSMGFSSCNDDEFDPIAQLNKEVAAIDSYLQGNNLTAIKDVTGIRMVISEMGTGLPASIYANSTVEVQYVGTIFGSGTKFDEGTTTDVLNRYVDGWQIALSKLPAGSKATLYIPSAYAYGQNPNQNIPGNSTLVFEIHFKRIVITSAQETKFKADTAAVHNYVNTNAIVTKDSVGLRYAITQEGSGRKAKYYDKVKVKYSFKLLADPTKIVGPFEFEPSDEFYSMVADYLPAMTIGLQQMREGSKATLYAPSLYAFGTNQTQANGNTPAIPASSNLIIEIELIDIVE